MHILNKKYHINVYEIQFLQRIYIKKTETTIKETDGLITTQNICHIVSSLFPNPLNVDKNHYYNSPTISLRQFPIPTQILLCYTSIIPTPKSYYQITYISNINCGHPRTNCSCCYMLRFRWKVQTKAAADSHLFMWITLSMALSQKNNVYRVRLPRFSHASLY